MPERHRAGTQRDSKPSSDARSIGPRRSGRFARTPCFPPCSSSSTQTIGPTRSPRFLPCSGWSTQTNVPTRYDAASRCSDAWTCLPLRTVERSNAVSPESDHLIAGLAGSQSRRVALHTGASMLAGLGAFALPRSTVAQATPTTSSPGEGLLLVQGFSHGSLFPTQGDVGVLPYTVILWDAADRGYFFADSASGSAGVVPTESVLTALGSEARAVRAVLVAAAAKESSAAASGQQVWALSQVSGSLGSDPGAVTYQGEPLNSEDAMALLGSAPAEL